MTDARLTLGAGSLEVQLLPAIGGSIVRFYRLAGGAQMLFRGAAADPADALGSGCFPLVPFVNRIRGGVFTCDGR